MACTANHDLGLPQSRHWCEKNFGCSTPLFICIGRAEEQGMDPRRVGSDLGGGGVAFSFNFNLSYASLVLGP